MRVVFIGANRTGWLCLREVLTCGADVVGVFTVPRQFTISYAATPVQIATYAPPDELAAEHGIPLVTVTRSLADHVDALRELRPDVVLVSGWYHLIPKKILDVPPYGVVGLHPSLLPRYRGGAPLSWAIINGERETGISLFYFTDRVDAGDMLGQAAVAIDDADTIATLYDKINVAAVGLVRDLVQRWRDGGSFAGQPQDERAATWYPQRRPEDGVIDWTWSSRALYDWIRAQTSPYPGAFTYLDGAKLTIWSARLLERPNNRVTGMAGYVMRTRPGEGVEVLTGDGSLLVTDIGHGEETERADRGLRTGMKLGLPQVALVAGWAGPLTPSHDAR